MKIPLVVASPFAVIYYPIAFLRLIINLQSYNQAQLIEDKINMKKKVLIHVVSLQNEKRYKEKKSQKEKNRRKK